MIEKKINLVEIDPVEIYGVNNRIFDLLCSYFPKVKAVARGTQITLQGTQKDITLFESKLDSLISKRMKKTTLTGYDVEELFEEKSLSKEEAEANAKKEEEDVKDNDYIICYGNEGRIIKARTKNQKRLVEEYYKNDLLFAVGPAGTGKTYTAIALAVRALKNKEVKRLILTRPAVEAGERLGFLPGDLKEKLDPYLQPLYDALKDMPSSGKQSVKALEDSIKSELVLIDDTFSGYNKGSEITRVNEAGSDTVEVNATFAELFGKSKTIWEESSGAFDPSGAPIFDIWGFGFSNKGKVTQHQIDSLKQFVGMDKIRIDSIGGRFYIIKSDPRIKLNFNAIAQGYTCDCIARILDSFGVGNYLVDLGEIVCKGVNGKGMKWIIGVEHPEDGNQTKGKAIQTIVSVTNCGIVTSGNYRKFYIENGKKYAHTIDPRTGYPAQQSLLSATAICKDGTTADAYATWFMSR